MYTMAGTSTLSSTDEAAFALRSKADGMALTRESLQCRVLRTLPRELT